MVADFLTVRREYAPLIDLALGERAQRFVVRDLEAVDELLRRRGRPSPAASAFCRSRQTASRRHDSAETCTALVAPPLSAVTATVSPGVVAPAEQRGTLRRPRLADLPSRLLGRTLIVRDLATARALAGPATGYRCVTLQGELSKPTGR